MGIIHYSKLKNVQQVYYIESVPNPISSSFQRMFQTIQHIKSYRPLFLFLLAYFYYIDRVDTIITMSSSYGTDIGITSNNLLIILLAAQIVAAPFATFFGKLADKFRSKTILLIGIGIYIIIFIYSYFVKTTMDFWIIAMMVASSQGGIQALSRVYFAKLVPKESSNEFFGFYNIFYLSLAVSFSLGFQKENNVFSFLQQAISL